MTGIVLAGGNNSRMGKKKAFINVFGNTIIDNIIATFQDIFLEIIIVTNNPEDFQYSGIKAVPDLIHGKGPLGGLYTGLNEARYEQCFVMACDMPYTNRRLIQYITGITGYDVVVPKINGRYEPLFACYSKKCAAYAREQLEEGNLRLSSIFPELRVKEIGTEELKIYDEGLLSLININTPEDLSKLIST